MPAPIAISTNEHDWIKQYLQEYYDCTILDMYDCQVISDAIINEKGIKISCSTFRRLFDLVPNNHGQSRFILNALAVAVGFKNWDVFKNHVSSFDTNMINQNIQMYSGKFPNSSKLILETIRKLPITSWMGGYQFQSIIAIAIENKDFALLDKIVNISFEIDNQAVYEHLVIGFQSIYFQSVKGNTDVINFVERNIGQSVVLQKCMLQAYVDESHLKGFLELWFNAVHENSGPDLLLFKNLLMCQKAFVIEADAVMAKQIFNIVCGQLVDITFEIHPILKARIGVWEIILNKNPAKLNDYFNALQNPFDIADFAVIGSRLLWMYSSKNDSICFLDNINCVKFPVVKDYFQKGRYNVLLLTLAINYYINEDFAKAQNNFKMFDRNTFGYDIVNIDFYNSWIEKLERLNIRF